MAVTIAENVQQNLIGFEQEKFAEFQQNPGYGGQRLKVRLNYSDYTVEQVNYGAGPMHTSVFYLRNGSDYQVLGVGQADGKRNGKAAYSALWDGHQNRRVQLTVLGKI